jgi:alpha-tubulin suppressor-like RCC1 family protein
VVCVGERRKWPTRTGNHRGPLLTACASRHHSAGAQHLRRTLPHPCSHWYLPPPNCWCRLGTAKVAHSCTEEGEVWAWGSGADGQLGLGTPYADCSLPQRVHFSGGEEDKHRMVQVAVGGNHSLALDGTSARRNAPPGKHSSPAADRGTVWCWGSSRFNQIGSLAASGEADADDPTPVPLHVSSPTADHNNPNISTMQAYTLPLPAPMAGPECSVVVTSIAAGLRHSAMITRTTSAVIPLASTLASHVVPF